MQNIFELARGSIPGYDHIRAGKNNQDGVSILQTSDFTIAVVCDGCSSGKYSEVGAQFGSLLLTHTIADHLRVRSGWTIRNPREILAWSIIRRDALWEMRKWARGIGAEDSEGRVNPSFVNDYFLFTVVCVVITPERTEFASIGDGCISVNGETSFLGPFEGNMPPYLGYGLVKTSMKEEQMQFVVHKAMKTEDLQSFLIGSDGLTSLHKSADKPLPGKTRTVGPMSQLWEDEKFFLNADVGRRHLVLANGGVGSRFPGLLEDDTTFVSGRRILHRA